MEENPRGKTYGSYGRRPVGGRQPRGGRGTGDVRQVPASLPQGSPRRNPVYDEILQPDYYEKVDALAAAASEYCRRSLGRSRPGALTSFYRPR